MEKAGGLLEAKIPFDVGPVSSCKAWYQWLATKIIVAIISSVPCPCDCSLCSCTDHARLYSSARATWFRQCLVPVV